MQPDRRSGYACLCQEQRASLRCRQRSLCPLLRREISDFIGRRTREILDRPEEEEREDKERRALVFGTEETAICFDAAATEHERIRIESFMPSEDRAYVLGIFEARAQPRRPVLSGPDQALLADFERVRARWKNSIIRSAFSLTTAAR
ncbi:hypothetical protein AJ87_13810 [Rhizobium yanglingense]|nr:hypothetical protein AJ87_13810 [Rhizobium yanglingense]